VSLSTFSRVVDPDTTLNSTRLDTHPTKHIDVKYHFLREVVTQGDIIVKKIATTENPVDMLTKPLPILKLKHCLGLIAVCSL
jgi:hypothetical protein